MKWLYERANYVIKHTVFHLQANGMAAVGKYGGGSDSAAAGQSLFVAQHAY